MLFSLLTDQKLSNLQFAKRADTNSPVFGDKSSALYRLAYKKWKALNEQLKLISSGAMNIRFLSLPKEYNPTQEIIPHHKINLRKLAPAA